MLSSSSWLPIWQTVLLLACALWIPGWGVLALANRSRAERIILAPLLSAGIIGSAAIATPRFGFPWGWAGLAIFTLVVWILGISARLVTRLFFPRAEKETVEQPTSKGIVAGALIAVPASAFIFLKGIHSLYSPPQTWDAVFHLNALRWIEQSGNGSSLHLSGLSSPLQPAQATSGGIYPAGLHDLAFLGWVSDPALTLNLLILLVISVVWPLGVGLLAKNLAPQKPFVHTAAMVLAVAYTAFPERPSSYGTLWPNVYAYALLPLIITLLMQWFGRTKTPAMELSTTVLLALGVIGLVTAHPTGVLVALVVVGVLVVDLLIRLATRNYKLNLTQAMQLGLLILAIGIAGYMGSKLQAWSTVLNWQREPIGSFARESFGVIFDQQLSWMGYGDKDPDYILGALTILGLFIACRYAKYRWWLVAWGIFSYLFVASAVVKVPFYFLVAPWYSDAVRLGAIIPLFGALLAAFGLQLCVDLCFGLVEKNLPSLKQFLNRNQVVNTLNLIQISAVICAIIGTNFLGYWGGKGILDLNYTYYPNSTLGALVSDSEIEFIKSLPNQIESGAAIATDPRTGGALIYAYTGLPVVHRHFDGSFDKDQWIIAHHFDQRIPDWRVCDRLKKWNAKYFYTDEVIYWKDNPVNRYFDGFDRNRDNPEGLDLVAQSGTAKLYKITNCPAE
ncbi:hypothetical protein HMPREF0044_0816 [Gleimia coleocanis DSM 15436]|uniref:Tat pathway signal sequence domain protein n=1 Tax=Gleimia coleocanis DSM 15436 TaxID=525245 RepID=C0VZT8_9ACTO|nr:DUF6541 family protein [Gleimia coleocanis]EEH63797.1 hypothetical protein HMPREF0044_0816 [Gleimia coleocanis DSM 15436]